MVVGRCDYFLYVRYFMIIFILSSGVWGNIVGKLVWIWVGQLDVFVILLLFLLVNYMFIYKFINIFYYYLLLCIKDVVIEVWYI